MSDTNTQPESRADLKPCPFCGSDPITEPHEEFYTVTCSQDACVLGNMAISKAAWNTRAARASSPAACVHEWELGDMTKMHDRYFWYCVKCKAVEETPDVNPPKGASSPAVPSEAVEVVKQLARICDAAAECCTGDASRSTEMETHRADAAALRTLLDHVSRPDRQASDAVEKERERIVVDLEKICGGEFGASNVFPEIRPFIDQLRGQSK